MNMTRFSPIRILLPALAAFALTACSTADAPGEPPLAGAAIGGPFTLTDQDGRRVSESDFDGRYRLVYFGFSYCPDVCPIDLQAIGAALRQFEAEDPARAARVQPLFITTDPERDTPEVLKPYVSAFHPRLIGLTGSPEEIADVARAYGIYYASRAEEGASDYLVDHSRVAYLFGPDGAPIEILPHDEGADAIAARLDHWVR